MAREIPVTFLFDYEHSDDKMRAFVMREFAANGAHNQVLTDTLIGEIMKRPGFAEDLKKDAEACGIRFVDAHAPFGPWQDLHVPVESARHLMLSRQKCALGIAAGFGVDSMTVHVGNATCFPQHSLESQHEAVLRSIDELLPVAESCKVTIAIENIWFPTNTPERLLDIIGRYPSEYLGVCFDAGHANLMSKGRGYEDGVARTAWKNYGEVSWDDRILEKLLPHITTCHLHDNLGQTDQHWLPGRGNVDWPAVMGLLKQAPRLKCYQCEVIPVRTGTAIADICRKFSELMEL